MIRSIDVLAMITVTAPALGIPAQETYLKASNTDPSDAFGTSVAIDGGFAIVGAFDERGGDAGVNADGGDNSLSRAGAAYIYRRGPDGVWVQEAYLKSSNPDWNDAFGFSVDIDGDTAVVGAHGEASGATGVNGEQSDNLRSSAGAVYVFRRDGGGAWDQEGYLKASNTDAGDQFGWSVAIDGDRIVVGAPGEDSSASGVNGDGSINVSFRNYGAAYVFERSGSTWFQTTYLKASNPGRSDGFGSAVALDRDSLIVGAVGEASMATGVGGDQSDNSAVAAGACYVFARSGNAWVQQGYLKGSGEAGRSFGQGVGISGDRAVVGAPGPSNDSGDGAAFAFVRIAGVWTPDGSLAAPLEASLRDEEFGRSVAIEGESVAVGSAYDGELLSNSGAVYLFGRAMGGWMVHSKLKASNPGQGDYFGWDVCLSGSLVISGARQESSAATGVNGDQSDNSASAAGAAYVFNRDLAPEMVEIASVSWSGEILVVDFFAAPGLTGWRVLAAEGGIRHFPSVIGSSVFESSAGRYRALIAAGGRQRLVFRIVR